MTLIQVWGCLLIFVLCPLIGGLPLISSITYLLTGKTLSKLGTGNVSVSAAFYHGGTLVGILAVLSEAGKGILTVLLARQFFPAGSIWEIIALIALVMGRYWMGKGAGTTNVLWGIVVHDPIAALLTVIIGGISFTLFRDRATGRLVGLFLLALILTLRHSDNSEYMIAVGILAGLICWIYQKIPDDLDLPEMEVKPESAKVFHFFRGEKAILSLNHKLNPQKVGSKAATLAYLKRLGYSVPDGWVLPPGDDPQPLIEYLNPSLKSPLVVRSSAVGEDTETSSAAGQYTTILNVRDPQTLEDAIFACQISYNNLSALQYRQDRQQLDQSIAVLVQKQIQGVFSGVAFSRDPIDKLNPDVLIEALPGNASQIVSGKFTPQQYCVHVSESLDETEITLKPADGGDISPQILKAVAILTRQIEALYHGIPQDIEWSYDGQQLWLLQARPITTLQPLWTRKIAAEVIPGVIRPLTWSINCPLTCGVWGDIFTLVLGKRSQGLDFTETATLHYQRAYFNATLLGAIFRRMGLPPESLEFLTRGAKFSKPPLSSTIVNLPGLFRLLSKEWHLIKDFERDQNRYFLPVLNQLQANSLDDVSVSELLNQIDNILDLLRLATYYSILAPLSFALRQAIFKVDLSSLDNSKTPEVASMRSLSNLAVNVRDLLPPDVDKNADLFTYLEASENGKAILNQFEQWLDKYGYLSEVATDIAVPRWKENPQHTREIFSQFLQEDQPNIISKTSSQSWLIKSVQKRLDLKGEVTEVYSRLLAHLRWCFLALESNLTLSYGDIFFLKLAEIRNLIDEADPQLRTRVTELIEYRRRQFEQNQQLTQVPFVIYGNPPASEMLVISTRKPKKQLTGIGASSGKVEGTVRIIRQFQSLTDIDKNTIVVVPYADSGWAPLLVRSGGIIAEVGGRLSHGAIIAREYGIPAVMDLHNATQLLRNGQRVRLDGERGIVEVL